MQQHRWIYYRNRNPISQADKGYDKDIRSRLGAVNAYLGYPYGDYR